VHFAKGTVPEDYLVYIRRKHFWTMGELLLLFILLVCSISVGAVTIPPQEVLQTLMGQSVSTRWDSIIWNIRLPQALAAIVAGAGLSVAGVVMQSILRNPIASPFTLGISNAGAFGAAFSLVVLGTGKMQSTVANAIIINNPYLTTMVAFLFCLLATGVILLISRGYGGLRPR
jgi:iron complex transport system permease protein